LAIEPLLVNGYAQFIPFSPSSFDQVAATFPAEYFWDLRTLQEVARVLRPGGTLLALPAAWITGSKPLQQAAHWLFQITGQAPARQDGPFLEEIISRLNSAGFQVDHEYKALKDSTVLLLIARKKAE
jgi:ubiquinone/menaquinone biosynthesis C-methylase UbiE